MKNYYSVLGLTEQATDDQIKQAYRSLAKRYHPDLHPGDAECARKFAMVNEAMEHVGDPAKRKEYDNERIAEQKQAQAQAQAQARAQAQAAQARAQAQARASAPPPGAGAAGGRVYAGTASGAAAVINDTYRKGYNEGYAAAQQSFNASQNAAAKSWQTSAESWQKEAETRRRDLDNLRRDLDSLRRELDVARQRAADAEAATRRVESQLRMQTQATDDAKRRCDAEVASRNALKDSYETKMRDLEKRIDTEREARRFSDADKVRLSREVTRLKEELDALRSGTAVPPQSAESGAQFASQPSYSTPGADFTASAPSYSAPGADFAAEEPKEQEYDPYIDALSRRAEDGDGDAALTLGTLYLSGDSVKKDAIEAVRWFTLGAANGSADALYNLGLCYVSGDGVDPDPTRGIELIKAAAYRGSEPANVFIRNAESKPN